MKKAGVAAAVLVLAGCGTQMDETAEETVGGLTVGVDYGAGTNELNADIFIRNDREETITVSAGQNITDIELYENGEAVDVDREPVDDLAVSYTLEPDDTEYGEELRGVVLDGDHEYEIHVSLEVASWRGEESGDLEPVELEITEPIELE
ncbi:hypothetical protein [Alkalicoccus luteus]|uniref:Lipoprotein n=1 Tax=Alkalicoccus luteus TaxID=1237094 RepID=A0A969TU76_9BACI|nr:hypothetical protein [Alkalicoccus luteus]NJP38423.1 hypothetical protein [Alkalicoccus luteus]